MKHDLFMAPIELIGLPWCETHGHVGLNCDTRAVGAPPLYKPMYAVVGAIVTTSPQFLE